MKKFQTLPLPKLSFQQEVLIWLKGFEEKGLNKNNQHIKSIKQTKPASVLTAWTQSGCHN
jgi:hypothetical protein